VTAPLTIDDLAGDPKRTRRARAMRLVFAATATSAIVITFAIVVTLVLQAARFITQIDLGQLWGFSGWFPRQGQFEFPTILYGSLMITLIAILIAGPIGLASAVYLSEYARPRVRSTVKPVLEILAGIPSVVVGFFTVAFINPTIVQRFVPGSGNFNLIAAGIGVGVLIIPLVSSISEDALASVPNSLREASEGLGARKITTVTKVVVPAAISGIVAAFIVAISRAIGETLVVTLAAGGAGGAEFRLDPAQAGLTMTGAMANLATGSDQVTGVESAAQSLYLVGFVLFVITLGLNVLADRIVRKYRQAY
jgi:phosphate transport system permease protein